MNQYNTFMSIVVAVTKNNQTFMASDTLTCFGDSQQISNINSPCEKIRRLGPVILGSTGWAIYDDILDNYLANNPQPQLSDRKTIFAFFLDFWKALHDRYTFVNDQSQAKDAPFGDLDSSFLIANANGIFKVSHDMNITHFNQYYAIGCAEEYALGAMQILYQQDGDAQSIAKRAVQTAIEFDVHCGGEITVLQVQ